jgi:MerR family copper efflux transcriptional regulator
MAISEHLHQIGEVADRLGLSLRTVRYYEEMGLITPAERTEGGFRLYSNDEIERLTLIKEMKPLGFTIQEMRALLDAQDTLRQGADANALDALKGFATAAKRKVAELREQLDRAEKFSRALERKARRHTSAKQPARR